MNEIFHFLNFQKFVNDNDFGKTFPIGKNGMNPLGILPLQQNVLPKGRNVSSQCI